MRCRAVAAPRRNMPAGDMDLTDQTEREIERAWLRHQPERDRIPAMAWRKLQTLKKQLEPTSSKIKVALGDEAALQSLVTQCCNRRGMARQRILADARRSFPGARIKIAHKDILEVSWHAPSPPVIADPKHPGEKQGCILVCYCVAWSTPPFGIRLCSGWSLEVPDHAGGRYLQRAGDDADFGHALFAAANHFYGADMIEVAPHVGKQSAVYLPTAGGAFVCTVVGAKAGGGQSFLYARAVTWIDDTMLRDDQQPLSKASAADKSVAALLLG
jgi:hypothetical protein